MRFGATQEVLFLLARCNAGFTATTTDGNVLIDDLPSVAHQLTHRSVVLTCSLFTGCRCWMGMDFQTRWVLGLLTARESLQVISTSVTPASH